MRYRTSAQPASRALSEDVARRIYHATQGRLSAVGHFYRRVRACSLRSVIAIAAHFDICQFISFRCALAGATTSAVSHIIVHDVA